MRISTSLFLIPAVFILAMAGLTGCRDTTQKTPESSGGVSEKRAESGGNSPPEISSIRITPQPTFTINNLTVIVKGRDPDRDPIDYFFEWEKNGVIIEAADTETLSSTFFKKGDEIYVTVTPYDKQDEGDPVTSDSVTIKNSVPVISFITITPIPAYADDQLTAVVNGRDLDDDLMTEYFQWIVNGEEIEDEISDVLENTRVAKGDVIEVSVVLSDGETESISQKSRPVTIQNGPPLISSRPSPSINDEDVYIYHVLVEDPDEDTLTYSLATAPEGMTIDAETGVVEWNVTKENIGVHLVEIEVTDTDGATVIQMYDLRIFGLEGQETSPPS